MTLNLKTAATIGVGLFIVGGCVGYWAMPTKQEQVEVVQEKERIKTVTVVKEITRPDGTKEKETSITEDKKKDKTEEKKTTIINPPNYMVTGLFDKDLNPQALIVSKRMFENAFIGAYVDKDKKLGLAVTYEF